MKKKLDIKQDERGKLIEVFKIPESGQFVYTTSVPGAVRGGHYHTRHSEILCVVEGEGKIRMRDIKTNEVKEYSVSGEQPETVEMPLNWTHNIQNIGSGEMKLLIWKSEIFNPEDPDTFPEEV